MSRTKDKNKCPVCGDNAKESLTRCAICKSRTCAECWTFGDVVDGDPGARICLACEVEVATGESIDFYA